MRPFFVSAATSCPEGDGLERWLASMRARDWLDRRRHCKVSSWARAGADSASQVAHSRRAPNRLASRNSPHSLANARHSPRLWPKQKPPCPVRERALRIRSLFRQGAAILSIAGRAAARQSDVAIDAKAWSRMTVNLLAWDVIGRLQISDARSLSSLGSENKHANLDIKHASSRYCMHSFIYACT